MVLARTDLAWVWDVLWWVVCMVDRSDGGVVCSGVDLVCERAVLVAEVCGVLLGTKQAPYDHRQAM